MSRRRVEGRAKPPDLVRTSPAAHGSRHAVGDTAPLPARQRDGDLLLTGWPLLPQAEPRLPDSLLPKEFFHYPETARVLDLLDDAARRSGVSRSQPFEDFLHMSVCAFSGGQLEEQYLATVQKHTRGQKGHRGCDKIADALAELILIMEQTRADIFGDLFQGAISHDPGQVFTPEPVCEAMARLRVGAAPCSPDEPQRAYDPCCGSGRMLLAVAKLQPHWQLIGQDIDLRCVRMTALNLALRNLYGWVIWGDTLRNETRLAYRTGFDGRGFISETSVVDCPLPAERLEAGAAQHLSAADTVSAHGQPGQLFLFD